MHCSLPSATCRPFSPVGQRSSTVDGQRQCLPPPPRISGCAPPPSPSPPPPSASLGASTSVVGGSAPRQPAPPPLSPLPPPPCRLGPPLPGRPPLGEVGVGRRWPTRPPPCLHLRLARRRRLPPRRRVGLWARARRWGAAPGRRCRRTYFLFIFCIPLFFFFFSLARWCAVADACAGFSASRIAPRRNGLLWSVVCLRIRGAGKGSSAGVFVDTFLARQAG